MKRTVTALVISILCLALPAQNSDNDRIMKEFSDTLKSMVDSFVSYAQMMEYSVGVVPKNTRPNPLFYKLFVPPTYYLAPIEQAFNIEWQPGDRLMNGCDSIYQAKSDCTASYEPSGVGKFKEANRLVNNILMNYYLEYPERVLENELYFADLKTLDELALDDKPQKEDVKKYMKVNDPSENTNSGSDVLIVKPNFWKKTGTGKIQFTQHGISENWYQGGESTNALYSEVTLTANYNDHQRVEFENKMEVKLGFITAPSDTVHSYRTNSDLFRIYSKLGIKAFDKWYYTLTGEFWTQFFPNYKTNSNDLVSSFLSPATLKLSLGMDFKQSKDKYNLSVYCGPLTYKHVSLRDDDIVNPSAFEVKAGESKANLYGSELQVNLTWKIRPNITYTSKFHYFTTYERVTINWENTFDFKLNRYLTTTLFLHPRFDDGVALTDDNKSYFQFKEMLTFGLAYTW